MLKYFTHILQIKKYAHGLTLPNYLNALVHHYSTKTPFKLFLLKSRLPAYKPQSWVVLTRESTRDHLNY